MESTADMNSTTQQFTTLDTQRRVKHSGLFLYEFNDVSKRLKGEAQQLLSIHSLPTFMSKTPSKELTVTLSLFSIKYHVPLTDLYLTH